MTLSKTFQAVLIGYFLFAMHLLLDTPGGTGLYLSFNAMSWLFVIVLISLGCWQVAKQKVLYYQQYQLWLLLGCILLAVPFLYDSPFKDHNILRYLGVIGGLLLLSSFQQFPSLKSISNKLLWLILIAVAIQGCVTAYQFLLAEPSANAWFDPSRQRPFGLFIQPNIMGTFLATGVAVSLYLLAKKPFKNKNIYILSALIAFCAFLVPATKSLAGLVGLIAATIFTAPMLFKRRKNLATAQLLILIISFTTSKVLFVEDTQSTQPDRNVEVRKDIYRISTQMILANPIKGYGYGGFERSYLDFHNALKVQVPTMNPPLLKLNHPHNELLFWGVEGGIAALIGILCFIIGYLSLLKGRFNVKKLALIGLVTPIVFHSVVELPFDSAASHWHILILLMSYTALELNTKIKTLQLPSSLTPNVLGVLIVAIGVPFLITTMHTTAIVIRHEGNNYQYIESFKKIINPLPLRDRIIANVNAHKLIFGFKEKDAELLTQYIDWALVHTQHTPREAIYQNMLLCLETLKKHTLYQQVLIEAKRTYPDVNNWENSSLIRI